MSDLIKVVSAFKRGIPSYVRHWPGRQDRPGIIRASGVHFLCPKKFYYNYWMPSVYPMPDYPNQIFMGQGTFLHSYLQEILLGTMGVLKGTWQTEGSTIPEVVDGFMPVDLAHKQLHDFARQEAHPVKYKEYAYYDEHWGLSGHCDGVISISRLKAVTKFLASRVDHPGLDLRKRIEDVDPDKDGYALLELKTTSEYKFKALEGPETISRWYKSQATIYQRLSGYPTTVFLYLNRDSAQLKPVIFTHSTEEDWDPVKRKISVIWESIRDERLRHEYEACATPEDTAAKECPFVERCFAGKKTVKFVARAKRLQPDRRWLDLDGWTPKNTKKIGGWLDSL